MTCLLGCKPEREIRLMLDSRQARLRLPALAISALWLASCNPLGAEEPLGAAPANVWAFFDVVVVGAGIGGSAAAIQAARLGARVAVVEETDCVGGQMNCAGVTSMDEG